METERGGVKESSLADFPRSDLHIEKPRHLKPT